MISLQQTALHNQQLALGGRMVAFGNWSLPIHYGSQIKEHEAVRTQAGLFDVSHMQIIDVIGKDALPFLQWTLANDVAKLNTSGCALYSCLLNEAGGIIDDLIVYHFDEQNYRLVVNAGSAAEDYKWLQKAKADKLFDMEIKLVNNKAILALQGPKARIKLTTVLGNLQSIDRPNKSGVNKPLLELPPFNAAYYETTHYGKIMVAATGYTGENGYEIIIDNQYASALWQALIDCEVQPCGLGARDSLRIEAGMNLYGQDMDANILPFDCGLNWTISLKNERPFIGRDALQSRKQQYQFYGLLAQDGLGILRAGQMVTTAFGAGTITSGIYSPTIKRPIAFARLPLAISLGDQAEVIVRNQLIKANVVRQAFVRYGKSLCSV